MKFCKCLNCRKTILTDSNFKICPKCDDELFLKIKKFLENNPDSNVKKISNGTKISEAIILNYLEDGRLQEKNNEEKNICTECGNEFNGVGKLCKNCLQKQRNNIEVLKELQNQYNKSNNIKKEDQPRMRHFK